MKYLTSLLIVFVICNSIYGAYTAPNEDTVIVVGGLGTQANAAQLNGGGATKVVWDAGSPSDFINTNGGPITDDTGCAFTDVDDTITKVGIGTGVTVGTLAYVVKTAGAGTITTGVYEVTAQTNDTIVISGHDASGDSTLTVNVGGAIDTLQNALDNTANDATSSSRYIYNNIAIHTITSTINIDTNTGSSPAMLFVTGYNSTLTAKSLVQVTTATDLANGLIQFDGTQSDYIFEVIDFNAGGKDDNEGEFCINDDGTGSSHIIFIGCIFRGAVSHGVSQGSDSWTFINCEAYLNGGSGIQTSSVRGAYNVYLKSSVHDNDSHGMSQGSQNSKTENCLFYDNGKDGSGHGLFIAGSVGDRAVITGNTSYGNADDGINIDNLAHLPVVMNNTSVGNGTYGYNLQGITLGFFGYNHSNGNTTAHYNEGADGTFADFGQGNNQTGAPLFTSVVDGSENFLPKSGSDLINNALEFGGTGTLDIGAVQEASGGGGTTINVKSADKSGGKQ